jgi:streptomycin 6-kinase
MRHLPEAFVQTIIDLHGGVGVAWLEALPAHLNNLAAQWDLTLGQPFDLSYNYVTSAVRGDGVPVVLKVGVPHRELHCEMAALRHYAGRGAVQLLEADPASGVMLLEHLLPGTPLRRHPNDDEATHWAAEVMTKLWRPLPPDHPFPTAAAWASGLQRLRRRYAGGTGPLPTHLVDRAEGLFRELLADAAPPVLLHGDLHHDNILSATRAPYLALDPKGLAGEPAYEVGALLRNPPNVAHWPDLVHVQGRRVEILAEWLGLDRARIIGYGFAQAVLSAWWTIEDHGEEAQWQPAIKVAHSLLPYL